MQGATRKRGWVVISLEGTGNERSTFGWQFCLLWINGALVDPAYAENIRGGREEKATSSDNKSHCSLTNTS